MSDEKLQHIQIFAFSKAIFDLIVPPKDCLKKVSYKVLRLKKYIFRDFEFAQNTQLKNVNRLNISKIGMVSKKCEFDQGLLFFWFIHFGTKREIQRF